jgi:putative MATE family efflux protein
MTKDLTHGSIAASILLFALPLILGNLFQQFYALADTIIVGRFVGVKALAAVGSTGCVNYLVLGFVIGLCNGFAIPIAQFFGARDESDMRRLVANSAWLCIAWAAALTLITVTLTRPMLRLMQTPADILQDASTYIGCIFAGIPLVFLYNMVAAVMRALGDSRTPLYFLLLTSGLNIALDLLFVLQFGMGVLGAALATDISQAISGVLSLVYLVRRFSILKMQKGEAALDRASCRRLHAMGIPFGLQCTITAVGGVIMQGAVNVLGSTAVAAVTAAGKTQQLLTVAFDGLGTSMATFTGQNMGAAKLERIRSGVSCAAGFAILYAVLAAVALHFTDRLILGLFLDVATEVEIVQMAQKYLLWNSLAFAPLGLLIILRYTIQGAGYSTLAMLAGVAEMAARTAVALLLVPALGFSGACLANPAAWTMAFVFLIFAYFWMKKDLDNRFHAGRLVLREKTD